MSAEDSSDTLEAVGAGIVADDGYASQTRMPYRLINSR